MTDIDSPAGPDEPARSSSGSGPFRSVSNGPRLWFGMSAPVNRPVYAAHGLTLALVKYAVEMALVAGLANTILSPLAFINPLLSQRMELMDRGPEWLPWLLVVWTFPFLWIAVSMSVRRASDAGISPWWGLLVLMPAINLVLILLLCMLPSRAGDRPLPDTSAPAKLNRASSAILGIISSLLLGGLMVVASISLLSEYGTSLFLGLPMLMGATSAFVFNRPTPRGYLASIGIGAFSVLVGGCGLLLFALEGIICIAMSFPLLVPLGALGGFMGKAIADLTEKPRADWAAGFLLLPACAGLEAMLLEATEYEVRTSVVIDANPQVVWNQVIDFPDLTDEPAWYFRMGIASPERARIEGHGVGAVRYCEFSTGTFVEPITHWEPARRLAFDVTDQPAPMFELSPYRHVHPPHLDGYLRSNRGEFLLVDLPGERTRLEGTTWYEFDMFPQWYWTLWSDALIHRIHARVLGHIKELCESKPAPIP